MTKAGVRLSDVDPLRSFGDEAVFNDADLSFVDFDSFSSDDYTPGTYN